MNEFITLLLLYVLSIFTCRYVVIKMAKKDKIDFISPGYWLIPFFNTLLTILYTVALIEDFIIFKKLYEWWTGGFKSIDEDEEHYR